MQKQLHIGDTVSVLDENLKGKVVAINGSSILIVDADSFERNYQLNELVIYKRNQSEEKIAKNKETTTQVSVKNSSNQLIQLGDFIAILDEETKGKVIKINGIHITIEETNGFENMYHVDQLIVYDKTLSSDQSKTLKKSVDKTPLIKQDVIKSSIVDLHNTNNYLDKNRILENQIIIFKEELNHAVRNGQTQITFIHGKGQGILKNEIERILKKEGITYKKAPHRHFGQGAIQVSLVNIDWDVR